MTNRRELLQIGLAASALPLAGEAVLAAAVGGVPAEVVVPLYTILYDARFPAGREFGRRAAANGHVVAAIHGDITGFWYDDLYHRWQQGPAAIAGFTASGALFCLEQLAWAERMRVVFRAEHAAQPACVTHALEGPAALVGAAVEALAAPGWPASMADVVGRCPRRIAERRIASARTTAPELALAAAEPLFSWVIAPVLRTRAR
jgi:hypothetical protein